MKKLFFPMENEIISRPVGYVNSTRAVAKDDDWDSETSSIVIGEEFDAGALAGLDEFTHIEVIYYFHKVDRTKISTGARHPRNNEDWPRVGIFAQRGKNRPNQLGVTICKLRNVQGKEILVSGLDAINGTPVLDIKPVMKEFLPREPINQPAWSEDVMRNYWKT